MKNDRRTDVGELANMPRGGQLSLCFSCGHIAVFCDDLTLREPNHEEMLAIAGDTELLRIQAARKKAYDEMVAERLYRENTDTGQPSYASVSRPIRGDKP